MQRKTLSVLLVLPVVLLNGCGSFAGHDYEEKIFTPGSGYYAGTTADKVQYGSGPTAVDQAIGGSNKVKTPCTEINEPITTLPVSPLDADTYWFFEADPESEEGQMTEEDWKKSQKTFKFPSSKAIAAPRRSSHISHYPTSQIFDVSLSKSPAIMFNQGVGYTTTYITEGTTLGNKLPNHKSLTYRITLEHLGRFWCCSKKSQPDLQVEKDSPFQLYRPDDDALQREVPQRGVLGFAGRTGLLDESTPADMYITIKLEYYYGAMADLSPGSESINQVKWLPLTFEEFWKLGPKEKSIQEYIWGGSNDMVTSTPEMPTINPDD